MPLAFSSTTHATIAFGYFNIEIDMLLLEQYFFFGPDFCRAVLDLDARGVRSHTDVTVPLEGWVISDRARAGNVNAAIRGWDLSGFIGATYERFPFPSHPEGFKQKPYGVRNQEWATEVIARYGAPVEIPMVWSARAGAVTIGEIGFTREQLAALVGYVDRGGYPRWESEQRPPHVADMVETLRLAHSPLAPPAGVQA